VRKSFDLAPRHCNGLDAARDYVRRHLTGRIVYNGRQVQTSGARVLKELKFLERLARETGVTLPWSTKKHFEDDLSESAESTARKRQAVSPHQAAAFIANLKGVARAFVITKALTVMRNEELYNLRVGHRSRCKTDPLHRRAKRKRIPTVALLPLEVRAVVVPLMKGCPADAWLFTCEGRKVQQSSFRKQFVKASKAAGLGEALGLGAEKELGGVSWIRHSVVVTALRPRLGDDAVQKYANHSSVKVTEEFYDLDKEALELKSQAVEEARKIFKLGPATPARTKRASNFSDVAAREKLQRNSDVSAANPAQSAQRRGDAFFSIYEK
jgi:hypothetical protein